MMMENVIALIVANSLRDGLRAATCRSAAWSAIV